MTSQLISSLYSRNQRKVAGGASLVSVKYHPGFYLTPLEVSWATKLAQVNTFTCLLGLQERYTWRMLEPTFGNYSAGFADIDDKLADLAGTNKRLIVFFEHKSVHDTDANLADEVVPEYAKTATYGGGFLMTDSNNADKPLAGGKIVKLFNSNVRNRLAVMAAAYGARYNSHPNFEGIGIIESAVPTLIGTAGVDFPSPSQEATDQYAIGIYKLLQAFKTAFPNTMVYQFANYLRPTIRKYIDGGTFGTAPANYAVNGFAQDGIAVGCPNVSINEYGLGGIDSTRTPSTPQPPDVGIYNHLRANAGTIPIMPSWQRPDFVRTTIVKTNPAGHTPTIQELYDFTKNSLLATHIFITPATASAADPIDHWQDVKNWFNANPSIRDSLTGGLISTKPSCYAAITTT